MTDTSKDIGMYNNYLIEDNRRLLDSLKVIRDFTSYNNTTEMNHINDVCHKTINKQAIYKPLS